MEERKLTISDLYPHLSPEEQQEAEENLERYLEVVLRIYERISIARRDLTDSAQNPIIDPERSKPTKSI